MQNESRERNQGINRMLKLVEKPGMFLRAEADHGFTAETIDVKFDVDNRHELGREPGIDPVTRAEIEDGDKIVIGNFSTRDNNFADVML